MACWHQRIMPRRSPPCDWTGKLQIPGFKLHSGLTGDNTDAWPVKFPWKLKSKAGSIFQTSFDKSPNLDQCILMKPKRIRLFIKPYCGWCHKAMRWFDERGVHYERVDVIADETAFDEMIRLSGQDLAPVLDVDGDILADFGPDQLADFWSKLEKKHARTESR